MSVVDAVVGSSTGTRVPRMRALIRPPRFGGGNYASDYDNRLGTWREAALARMIEVFPTNRGLRPMYMLMARAHRYAIDYIEQAPVIVLAAARGNAHVSWSERAFIQEQLRKMCQSKAQLRDVMRSYGLHLPFFGNPASRSPINRRDYLFN